MQVIHKRQKSSAKSVQRTLKTLKDDSKLLVYGNNKLTQKQYHLITEPKSSSMLKDFADPAKSDYWLWCHYVARNVERKETPAMIMGDACHTILLEPKLFNERYMKKPDTINRRTKLGREEWAELEAKCAKAGIRILDDDQWKTATAYGANNYDNPTAKQLLRGCQKEVSGFRILNGHLFKGRGDAINWQMKMGFDVKTVADISPEGFAKQAANLRYDLQEYTYKKIFGLEDFAFICYSKEEPLECVIYQLSDTWGERTERDWNAAIERITRVSKMTKGEAQSYTGDDDPVIMLDAPYWFERG